MANEKIPIAPIEKIYYDVADRKNKPSERLVILIHERNVIVECIDDTEKELEIVKKTDADYAYITEQLRYMKGYKDTLGKRIKTLVDNT